MQISRDRFVKALERSAERAGCVLNPEPKKIEGALALLD